jgi:hypothetical protein
MEPTINIANPTEPIMFNIEYIIIPFYDGIWNKCTTTIAKKIENSIEQIIPIQG